MPAGNPKHIKEMLGALLSNDATKDVAGMANGPAIKVLPNGRVQLLISSIYAVPVPTKTTKFLTQQFEQQETKQQMMLKLASSFKAFTPWMLVELSIVQGVQDGIAGLTERDQRRLCRDYQGVRAAFEGSICCPLCHPLTRFLPAVMPGATAPLSLP